VKFGKKILVVSVVVLIGFLQVGPVSAEATVCIGRCYEDNNCTVPAIGMTATNCPNCIKAGKYWKRDGICCSRCPQCADFKDNDGDGKYDYGPYKWNDPECCSCTDDNEKTKCNQPIPEFTTIAIPVIAIIGILFLFSRRKRKE